MLAKMVAVNRGSSILSFLVLVHFVQVTVQEEFIVVGGNVGVLGGRAGKGPDVSGTLASIDQKIAARNPGYFAHSPNRKRYADATEFALRPGQNMRRKLKRSPVDVEIGNPRRGRRTRFPRAPRHPYHPRTNRHIRNPRSRKVVAKRYRDDSVIVVNDEEEDSRRPRAKKSRYSSQNNRYPGSNNWDHSYGYEEKKPKKMTLKVRSVPSERPAYSVANTVIGGKPADSSSSEEQQSPQSSSPPYNQGHLDGYMKQLMKLSQVMLSSSRDLVNGGFPSPQSSADPPESSFNPKDKSGEVSGSESAQGKASEFQTSGSTSGSAILNGGSSALGSGYQSWEDYEPGKTILYGPNLGFNFAGSDGDGLSTLDYGYGGDKKNSVSSPNLHFYFFSHKDPNFGGLPNNFYAESAGSGSELSNPESPEADKKSSGEAEQNNPSGGEGSLSELPNESQQGGSLGSVLPEKGGGSGEQGNGPRGPQDFEFGPDRSFGGKKKRSRVHRHVEGEEIIEAELEVPIMERFTPADAIGQVETSGIHPS